MDVSFMDIFTSYILPGLAGLFAIIYLFSGLHIVDQWEVKPFKRFGKYAGSLTAGITWREPFSTRIIETIDIRDVVENLFERLGYKKLPTVQTHDNVPVTFNAQLTYKITDPAKSVLAVEDVYQGLWQRSLTIISEHVSNTQLDDILHDRKNLYRTIEADLQESVADWGIHIIAVEMKDVSISDTSIQEAIAMKARAQKEAEAELTRATMQSQVAEQLKAAAEKYDEAAWKLKGFETLLELCRSAQNNTVMIPTDLVQAIARITGK
jgi:regulator of protease activity HflC (stomatin/prohibitin superfamily)